MQNRLVWVTGQNGCKTGPLGFRAKMGANQAPLGLRTKMDAKETRLGYGSKKDPDQSSYFYVLVKIRGVNDSSRLESYSGSDR